jgi:hypothetical protein
MNEGVADRISGTDAATHTPLSLWIISDRATQRQFPPMSAVAPIADIRGCVWDVRYVPEADIPTVGRLLVKSQQ